jgi:hypothetical protein
VNRTVLQYVPVRATPRRRSAPHGRDGSCRVAGGLPATNGPRPLVSGSPAGLFVPVRHRASQRRRAQRPDASKHARELHRGPAGHIPRGRCRDDERGRQAVRVQRAVLEVLGPLPPETRAIDRGTGGSLSSSDKPCGGRSRWRLGNDGVVGGGGYKRPRRRREDDRRHSLRSAPRRTSATLLIEFAPDRLSPP